MTTLVSLTVPTYPLTALTIRARGPYSALRVIYLSRGGQLSAAAMAAMVATAANILQRVSLTPLSASVVVRDDPEPVAASNCMVPAPAVVDWAYLGMAQAATVPDPQMLSMSSASSLAADGRLFQAIRREVAFFPPYPMIARQL